MMMITINNSREMMLLSFLTTVRKDSPPVAHWRTSNFVTAVDESVSLLTGEGGHRAGRHVSGEVVEVRPLWENSFRTKDF